MEVNEVNFCYRKKHMELTIQRINKESFLFIFYLYIRWVLSYFLSYSKAVPVKSIKYNNVVYDCKTILITSTGIDLNIFHVPYENIFIFKRENNNIILSIFAKITDTLELSSTISEITIECENTKFILSDIKRNMYYHIKYNKINQNVIDVYLKDKQDKQD